jgi:type IV secretory pathway TrbD component
MTLTEQLLTNILSKMTALETLVTTLSGQVTVVNGNLATVIIFIKAFFIIMGIAIGFYVVKWIYYSWIRHFLIELGIKHIF